MKTKTFLTLVPERRSGESPGRSVPRRKSDREVLMLVVGFCALLLFTAAPVSAASLEHPDLPSPELLMEEGGQAFQRGAFDQAVRRWKDAASLYERAGRLTEQSDALNRLVHAYQAMGQHHTALQTLEVALEVARQSGDRLRMATVLASLGQAYLVTRQMEAASQYLNEALDLARTVGEGELTAALLNDRGILLASQEHFSEAIAAYRESEVQASRAHNDALAGSALMNAARAAMSLGRYEDTKDYLDRALPHIQSLDASHDKAYSLIRLGLGYEELGPHLPKQREDLLVLSSKMFQDGLGVTERIGDSLGTSYAWGYLGHLYESEHRYEEALRATQRAVFAAQLVNAPESLYRWDWQTGRILAALGQLDDALLAYRRAVYTLLPIRQEASLSLGGPASFQETQRPLFLEMADLLLQRAALTEDPQAAERYLLEAREVVELLKAAELRDYFRDECVDALRSHRVSLDVVSKTAVVIYPILFSDRLELLVSFPMGLKRFTVPVTADTLAHQVVVFRERLDRRATREYLPHAQQLYDWLIRPLEPELGLVKVDTVVFVPDGPLRTIPLAALHDGKQFLIEKYAVATTPGLNLTDPRPIERGKINLLASGLTEAVQGFPALPYVATELQALRELYGGDQLIDQRFLVSTFEKELKERPFTVLHIASHGQFDRDVAQTFVLTFDDKLTLGRLSQFVGLFRFRKEPLELLALSACETAAGDDRAALGLAGVAIKAGARSALATLWFVNDQMSAELVAEFYRQLRDPSVSKAVALQRAQLKFLSHPFYQHPGYWAPFLLLNNWL